MERLGELAAFGTAVFWTASALTFEGATKRVGALPVNFWKVVGALVLLTATSLVTRGTALPFDASPGSWLFLSLSGLIGFVIADYFLFTSYMRIGSRVTVVFQALTPLFTAGFGYLLLGETMDSRSVAGMATVIGGILILVIARNAAETKVLRSVAGATAAAGPGRRGAFGGYLFAFLSAVFQALGLVVSKMGLGDIDAVSATQIRVIAAIAGFALQAIFVRQLGQVLSTPFRDRTVRKRLAFGSVVGPFLGVVLSLYALQHASAGTASTLMALTPVLIIPPSMIFLRQRVRPLEAVGACVAVAGTALFFLL